MEISQFKLLVRAVLLLALASFSFIIKPSFAEELDAASQEALLKTQELLKNPALRNKAVTADPNAARAHSDVEALGGSPQDTQAIYELAADLFGDLAKEAQGDPVKMIELLNKAGQDPNSLTKKLTPAQIQKLKELSNRLPAGTKTLSH